MENTPKEIVVTVPESLAGISIRKDIHYSDDTVISIRVEEHDPGRYSGSGPDFTFYAKGHDIVPIEDIMQDFRQPMGVATYKSQGKRGINLQIACDFY